MKLCHSNTLDIKQTPYDQHNRKKLHPAENLSIPPLRAVKKRETDNLCVL